MSSVSVTVSQDKNIHSFTSLTIKLCGLLSLLFHQKEVTKGVKRLVRTSISLSQMFYRILPSSENGEYPFLIWLKVASGGIQRPAMVMLPEGIVT